MMPGCSLETMDPPLKERKISSTDEEETSSAASTKSDASRDDPNEIWSMDSSSSNGSMTKRSTASSEVRDDKISAYNSSVDESESTDAEYVREVPDYLRRLTDEKELCSSYKANLPLFEGSEVNVLQALCGYFLWFTEDPGTSKALFLICYDCIMTKSYPKVITFHLLTMKPLLL